MVINQICLCRVNLKVCKNINVIYHFQNCLGAGYATRTVHNGVRSTSAYFVSNFMQTNLTIRTGVYVDRIILEKNKEGEEYKAVVIEAHDDVTNESIILKANKEIILSAG